MERVAFKMKLKPGCEQEYKKRHDAIWPALVNILKESGIEDYSIFLDETTLDLVGVMKISDPGNLDELPARQVMQEWWHYMSDIMETNPDHSPQVISLKEVFYLQ